LSAPSKYASFYVFFLFTRPRPRSTLFPYTTLFRSLLVVEKNCTVANQRNRVAPCRAAVGRATDQDRARRPRGEHLAVERKRALIDRTVGRESDPGIRRARVIAAVRGASAGATRERGHVLGPCPSSIE